MANASIQMHRKKQSKKDYEPHRIDIISLISLLSKMAME